MDAADFARLVDLGYQPEVDPAQTATLTRPGLTAAESRATLPGIPGFACYRTVEETYDSLDNLAPRSPHLAQWHRISAIPGAR